MGSCLNLSFSCIEGGPLDSDERMMGRELSDDLGSPGNTTLTFTLEWRLRHASKESGREKISTHAPAAPQTNTHTHTQQQTSHEAHIDPEEAQC